MLPLNGRGPILQFFIIELEHFGRLQPYGDRIDVVVVLPQIDIEYPQALWPGGSQKLADCKT